MERIQVWVDDCLAAAEPQLVGELQADDPRGRVTVRFRYADEWLAEGGPGFAIDPELRSVLATSSCPRRAPSTASCATPPTSTA